MGGGERGEKSRLPILGQFTGAFGQLNGFRAGAESGIRSGGKNPRKFIERVSKVRLEPQRLAVLENGFLGFVLLGQSLRQSVMRLREIRPFSESGGEMTRGLIRFVVQQQNQAKVVLNLGIVRSQPPGGVKMCQR